MGVGGQCQAPAALPPRKARCPCAQAVWALGPGWTDAENLAPPGLETSTIEPVASRYTDNAIPAYSVVSVLF
jgi:hypothetical protein